MGAFPPSGTQVDLLTVVKRIKRLMKFIQDNEVSLYQPLSTTILGDVTTLNTLIQGSSSNQGLSASPTLQIYDDPEQTANSNSDPI